MQPSKEVGVAGIALFLFTLLTGPGCVIARPVARQPMVAVTPWCMLISDDEATGRVCLETVEGCVEVRKIALDAPVGRLIAIGDCRYEP